MERLGERVEKIEKKSPWDGQLNNTVRNPNFRRNQNQNTGKTGPDQNIRPPFQENYVEGSTSKEPTEDVQINNFTKRENEPEIFLTQEDQEAHILKKFQTQSGNHLTLRKVMIQPFTKFTRNII